MKYIAIVLPALICFALYAYMMANNIEGKWFIFTFAVLLSWDGMAAMKDKGVGGDDL